MANWQFPKTMMRPPTPDFDVGLGCSGCQRLKDEPSYIFWCANCDAPLQSSISTTEKYSPKPGHKFCSKCGIDLEVHGNVKSSFPAFADGSVALPWALPHNHEIEVAYEPPTKKPKTRRVFTCECGSLVYHEPSMIQHANKKHGGKYETIEQIVAK